MSKQIKQPTTSDRVRPYPSSIRPPSPPFTIFPTGPAITAKLAQLEQQTGLDPALIIRCLILGADVKLVQVCAAAAGLAVIEPETVEVSELEPALAVAA